MLVTPLVYCLKHQYMQIGDTVEGVKKIGGVKGSICVKMWLHFFKCQSFSLIYKNSELISGK